MVHETAVVAIAFSRDSEALATGEFRAQGLGRRRGFKAAVGDLYTVDGI